MPLFGLHSWSQYITPDGLPKDDLTGDTHANDPAADGYSASSPTWIGETFTFKGGALTQIEIEDDDRDFEDAYVETGAAQTLAQDITIDGVHYPAGSVVENEFSLIAKDGQELFVVRINGENVGFTYGTGEAPTRGEQFTAAQGRDGAPEDSGDRVSASSEPYADIVCFAQGTLIETPDGPRRVEVLRAGDMVTTLDNGPMPVLWHRSQFAALDNMSGDFKPILISAGALGPGCPGTDLIVSPQHRVFVGGSQLGDLFESEAFAPAKALTQLPGIRQMRGKRHMTWVHFSLAGHEVIFSNECLTESLLLGPMVVNGLTRAEQQVVYGLYGRPTDMSPALNGPPAREVLTVGAVERHLERCLGSRRKRSAAIEDWNRDLEQERLDRRPALSAGSHWQESRLRRA